MPGNGNGRRLPASEAQQQLFFLQKLLGPQDSTYHVPIFYEIDGPVDVSAIRQAVTEVALRHEALRTRFSFNDTGLAQVVAPRLDPEWTHETGADLTRRAQWMALEATRPFNLESGPLFRVSLLECVDGSRVLMLAFHHIVCDGWSVDIVVEELSDCYGNLSAGRHPGLPEVTLQYGDYAIWQREWMKSGQAQEQLAYWAHVLGDRPPVLELPADLLRAASEAGAAPAGTLDARLPPRAVEQLTELGFAVGTTLSVALLAAYQVLLAAYTGLDDLIVGMPMANRNHVQTERTVGYFVNMVAVRVDLSGSPTFRELLKRARRAFLDAQDNQEVPFGAVVQRVSPARDAESAPIFQVLFMMGDTAQTPFTVAGRRFAPVGVEPATAKFQLSMEISSRDGSPWVALEYPADQFSPRWARSFADRFSVLLERIVDAPDTPVGELVSIPETERKEPGGGQDRPASDVDGWGDEPPYAEPRNEVERELARIWADVTGRPSVGIDDNYFDLGGDSIRSVQVVANAAERGLVLGVRDLLLNQTVRELATAVSRAAPDARTPLAEPFALIDGQDRAALPGDAVDAYPLAALQAGMIYHGELQAVHALYHDVAEYHIRGPYEPAAWRSAVRELLERHEILRTSFALSGYSEPLQIVHRHAGEIPMTFEDISAAGPAEQVRLVARRRRWERDHRFDYGQAPLMRFHVQKRSEETFHLWICEHHAINDGWSGRMLYAELLAGYARALGHDAGSAEPVPAARYRSFVALEREAVKSPDHRAFWSSQLDGFAAAPLPLAASASPPDMVLDSQDLRAELSEGLTGLARKLRHPIRTVLLAAHLRVLGLLSGVDDVVSGVVYNGRVEEPDADRVAGLFLNTLPFRTQLDGTWADLIDRVAATDLAIQPHRRFPAAEIFRSGDIPLPEVFFNYTHFRNEKALPAHFLQVLEEDSVVPTNFPLGAEFFRDSQSGLIGLGLRRDAARTQADECERYRSYYLAVLQAMVDDPYADSGQVELLTGQEQEELKAWNDTAMLYPRPHLLHQLVEQSARDVPDGTAVLFGDRSLTYRELESQASVLARRLREQGVGRRDRVAVCMERSLELVVSLLAVLKAGAAYVAVDPENPAARIADMVNEADVRLVLVGKSTERLAAGAGRPVQRVALGQVPPAEDVSALNEPDGPAAGDPAYLIFTSGSTGKPKGVVVSHRAICNRLLWMQQEFELGPGDKVLQKTPYSFDVSVWEFFWPLMEGACLVVAAPGGHRDPDYLAALIQRQKITVVHFVPSMLRAFLANEDVGACTSLARVICSGEALTSDLRDLFYQCSSAELVNLYGPTEAAVDVTCHRCRREETGPVPIGSPISNLRVHVLDPRRGRLPVRVPGELYLGGVGLADGYFGDPELTEERFVKHVWPNGTAERLYRTGDLVRRRDDGELEYLGRTDHQLKIRGMRVEPGEIEARLAAHPQVRSAAVTLRDGRLVAYVAGVGQPPGATELRQYLIRQLPEYMIPAVWVPVDVFPLSPSGKLDRKRLPAPPASVDRVPHTPVNEARTDMQKQLAQLWQEVLDCGPAGLDASFFELGGHSLLALNLAARIRGQLGIRMPVADLLAYDTVRKLAERLERHQAEARDDAAVLPIRRSGGGAPLWLIHPIGGGVFCYLPLAGELDRELPVFAVVSEGLATGRIRHRTVEETAESYVRLVEEEQPTGAVRLAGWSYGALLAFEMACQFEMAGREVDLLCMIDVAFPNDQFRAELQDTDMALLLFANVMKAAGVPIPEFDAGQWRQAMAGQLPLRDKMRWLVDQLPADALGMGRGIEQWEAYFSVFTANLAAHNDYRPGRYHGTVRYLEGLDGRAYDSARHWSGVVDGEFLLTDLAAEHYDVLRPPYSGKIAEVINRALGS